MILPVERGGLTALPCRYSAIMAEPGAGKAGMDALRKKR